MANSTVLNAAIEGCGMDYSSCRHFDGALPSHDLAVKYVDRGTEQYHVDRASYSVQTGHYLVVNRNASLRCVIDSDTPVQGICTSLSLTVLRDTARFVLQDDGATDAFLTYLQSADLFTTVLPAGSSTVGTLLQGAAIRLQSEPAERDPLRTAGFMLQLAEHLVQDQWLHFRCLAALQAQKMVTRQDLYRRLLDARAYMDAHVSDAVRMEEVASAAHLSLYHFYRLFRCSFNCTPYQYLLQRRLEAAKVLLQQGTSVSDAAFQTGFADIFGFSRMFRKKEGQSPGQYQAAQRDGR